MDSERFKIMMQTRVAVRDKTPHRFQIVPLRDVTNLPPTTYAEACDLPKPISRNAAIWESPQESLAIAHSRTKTVTLPSLPSRDLLTSFVHSGSRSTPRASTGSQPRQEQPHTLTAHISQISQLFSSENVAPLPSVRRNRSMTVSSIRSDTSVGMSDTSQETEAKLKRRHAIYRESSYTQYLAKSQHTNLVAEKDNAAISVPDTHLGPLLQPPFDLKQTIPHGHLHIPDSGSLIPMLPLKLSKKRHPGRLRMAVNGGESIYHPPIVLELFQDIDEAIAQWSRH